MEAAGPRGPIRSNAVVPAKYQACKREKETRPLDEISRWRSKTRKATHLLPNRAQRAVRMEVDVFQGDLDYGYETSWVKKFSSSQT